MNWLLARYYDRAMAASERAFLGEWRAELLASAEGVVIEVGAGTGANLDHYPDAVADLTLAEPNEPMRRQLVRAVGSRAGVRVSSAAAEELPFDSGSADVVVATLVLCSVSDVDASLREVWRVLRPGGRFLFLEHVAACTDERLLKKQQWVQPVWRRLFGNCHTARDSGQRIREAGFVLEQTSYDLVGKIAVVRPTLRGVARKP